MAPELQGIEFVAGSASMYAHPLQHGVDGVITALVFRASPDCLLLQRAKHHFLSIVENRRLRT